MPWKKCHKKWIENLKKRKELRKEEEASILLEPSVFVDAIQAKEEIVSEHDIDLNEEYIYKINTPGIKVEIEEYIKSENEVKIEEMTFGDYDADVNLPPIVSQSKVKVEPFIHEEVEDESVVPSGASAPAHLEQPTEEIGSGHDVQEKIDSIIKTECFFPSSEMSCFSFSRKRCRKEYSDCAISDLLDESCYFDFSDETLTTPAKRLRTSSSPPTQTHENLAALPLTMKQETDPLQVDFAPMTSDVLEIPSQGSRPDIHLEDTFSDDHMIEKSKHSVTPTPVPRRFSEQKMADLSINKCLAKSKDLAEMSEASPETKIKEFIGVPGPSSHPDLTLKERPLGEDLSATTIDLCNICEPSTAQECNEELASEKIVLNLDDDDDSLINNALDLLHNLPQTQQLPKYNTEGSKEINLEQMDPGLSPVEGKEVYLKDVEKVEKEIESDGNVDLLPTVGGESFKLATEEMKENIVKCGMEHSFERTKIPPRYVPRETLFKDFDPDPLKWDSNIETCVVQIPQITKLLKDSLVCKTCGEGDIEVELKSNEGTFFNEILILKCNTCNKTLSEENCSELVEIQKEFKNLSKKVAITAVAWIMAVLDSGIGYTKMAMAFSTLNIAPLSSMSYDYNKKWIVDIAFKKAEDMKKLAADAVKSFYEADGGQQVDGLLNIPVLFDGTFMKRGFASLLFIGFVTEIETGIILDFEIMTKLCSTCEKHLSMERLMSKVEFDEMRRKHKSVCLINFDVEKSSGSMKPTVAKAVFERSPFLGLRYTTLLTDEDSSSVYKTLKEANIYGYKFPIQKQNCLNHLNKKLYNRLHKIRSDSSLGGNSPGNLTQDVCKLLADLYSKCVKKFNKNYKLIKRTVLGSIFHYASSDNRPMHFLCQGGKNSPCEFQKLISNNEPIPQDWHERSIKYKINTETAEALITVLEPFLRDDVLEKAFQGAQNIKDSLHSRLGDISSRTNFRTFADVRYAVCRTFLLHNRGAGEVANTPVGKYQTKIMKQDRLRRKETFRRKKKRNFLRKRRRNRMRLLREQEVSQNIHT